MERLLEKIAMAEKTLGKLAEAADIDKPSELERDAIIQRFEFSFEAVWKAAQAYLRDYFTVSEPPVLLNGTEGSRQ